MREEANTIIRAALENGYRSDLTGFGKIAYPGASAEEQLMRAAEHVAAHYNGDERMYNIEIGLIRTGDPAVACLERFKHHVQWWAHRYGNQDSRRSPEENWRLAQTMLAWEVI